jgi:hypothetical protein
MYIGKCFYLKENTKKNVPLTKHLNNRRINLMMIFSNIDN